MKLETQIYKKKSLKGLIPHTNKIHQIKIKFIQKLIHYIYRKNK